VVLLLVVVMVLVLVVAAIVVVTRVEASVEQNDRVTCGRHAWHVRLCARSGCVHAIRIAVCVKLRVLLHKRNKH
jgi:hypothetical protein